MLKHAKKNHLVSVTANYLECLNFKNRQLIDLQHIVFLVI